MIISVQYITFETFWLNSSFCARHCTKRIAKTKAQCRKGKVLSSFATLIMLHLERILYTLPLLLNMIVEGKSKLHRAVAATAAYVMSLLTCSYVLFPLVRLAWLSTAIGFYTNGGYNASENLKAHIVDLCSQRQALYDGFWVTSQNVVFKIFLILSSTYLLVLLVKIIVEQLAHIIFDRKK